MFFSDRLVMASENESDMETLLTETLTKFKLQKEAEKESIKKKQVADGYTTQQAKIFDLRDQINSAIKTDKAIELIDRELEIYLPPNPEPPYEQNIKLEAAKKGDFNLESNSATVSQYAKQIDELELTRSTKEANISKNRKEIEKIKEERLSFDRKGEEIAKRIVKLQK